MSKKDETLSEKQPQIVVPGAIFKVMGGYRVAFPAEHANLIEFAYSQEEAERRLECIRREHGY